MRLSMAGLPAVLGFLCLYIVPVGMTIWYSFLENSFTMIFAGVVMRRCRLVYSHYEASRT